ncbi:MAG: 50S ribosomal protein L17 [Flavobacteriaceae bacterium]|jgi:large subunit ribosomal protein L17|nr:50S ribosomal protein L17 [Flavobacteriaceae bacterium]MDP4674928.1 50S ribosomal protein L17 [Flavobacteriaceae bacterium]MDP4755398.1 50S ribosomal protein L17 [Flavobacteriaceae bacterium]MDP4885347.1 50S ribosomal protein L17 [Flavobacteriaceae bacterium]MDP4970538.1 50S ribosomal protein L17 [Flavobacteriaceae bacterium]
MRHGKKINHLGRKTAHRKAMLANMACSLIEHKRINTTLAKAKALKVFVEPLITKAKAENNQSIEKGTHNRRIVFSQLRDKETITELFSTVSEKVGDRPGGYTRIIKLGNRMGDNADMAMIELVDFNELYNADKPKAKKTRRKKKADAPAVTAAPAAAVVEAPVEETPAVEAEAPLVEETPAAEEAQDNSAEEQESKGQDA